MKELRNRPGSTKGGGREKVALVALLGQGEGTGWFLFSPPGRLGKSGQPLIVSIFLPSARNWDKHSCTDNIFGLASD
jgi:hypothetical protein